MKKSLALAALLTASGAYANLIVVPTELGCKEAVKNNKEITAYCKQMEAEKKKVVQPMACPVAGGCTKEVFDAK